MKEIKRQMMNGYVEFTDGTFGVKLQMEQFVKLAKGKGVNEFYIDDEDNIYMMVHEDEASAHEPDMFLDEFDYEDTDDLNNAISNFYDMYCEDDVPFMLNINVKNAVQILDAIDCFGGEDLYMEYREALMRDIASDMEYFGELVARENNVFAKDVLNELSMVYNDVYEMEM